MSLKTISILFLNLVVFGWSCREIYYPEDVYSADKIPVIQGNIMENEVPVITIYWAHEYNNRTKRYISGAHVYITDNFQNGVDLQETDAGIYTLLTDEYRGKTGNLYTLHVELPDGNEYASNPVLLPKNPTVDSFYADPGTKKSFIYDEQGNPIPETQQGLYLMADISGETDTVLYYRFETKVLSQLVYSDNPGSTQAYSVYIWELFTVDNNNYVDFTIPQGNKQILREHPVAFLPYYYDNSAESGFRSGVFMVGWQLGFDVYAISDDVYRYYQSIEQQLSSNNQLLAPIPSQIESNLRCLNDPNKIVMGVFEACSKTTIFKAFGWKNMEEYYSKDLNSFPNVVTRDSLRKFPPDFWVTF